MIGLYLRISTNSRKQALGTTQGGSCLATPGPDGYLRLAVHAHQFDRFPTCRLLYYRMLTMTGD